MILHALELLGRDLAIGFAACTVISFGLVGLIVVSRSLAKRADRRNAEAIERHRAREAREAR